MSNYGNHSLNKRIAEAFKELIGEDAEDYESMAVKIKQDCYGFKDIRHYLLSLDKELKKNDKNLKDFFIKAGFKERNSLSEQYGYFVKKIKDGSLYIHTNESEIVFIIYDYKEGGKITSNSITNLLDKISMSKVIT